MAAQYSDNPQGKQFVFGIPQLGLVKWEHRRKTMFDHNEISSENLFTNGHKLTWEKERGLNSFALGFNVDFLTCLNEEREKQPVKPAWNPCFLQLYHTGQVSQDKTLCAALWVSLTDTHLLFSLTDTSGTRTNKQRNHILKGNQEYFNCKDSNPIENTL